jgi:hypothetical protein
MASSLKSFFLQLALFSIATSGLIFLWKSYAPLRFQTHLSWFIWLFFIITTSLVHVVLIKSAEGNPKKFVNYFMGITAAKLFAYLIIITFYTLLRKEAALGFVLFFLLMYFFYSAFEVVTLLRHFKK